MIAYNADSGSLMGSLYHYPPTEGRRNEERRVYEWDTGVSLRSWVNVTHLILLDLSCSFLCIFLSAELSWNHPGGKPHVQRRWQRQ